MRRLVLVLIASMAVLSSYADGRGKEALLSVESYYSSIAACRISLNISFANGQKAAGELGYAGKNLYAKIGDNEIFVVDSLRYEVNHRQKEVVIDRADAYSGEGANSVGLIQSLSSLYNVVEYVESSRMLRLSPKSGGDDTISVYVAADGKSVERVQMGSGANAVTISVGKVQLSPQLSISFNRAQYAGYEVVDFR